LFIEDLGQSTVDRGGMPCEAFAEVNHPRAVPSPAPQ
jgi:hypothetical protein